MTSESFYRKMPRSRQPVRSVMAQCRCGDVQAYNFFNIARGFSTRCRVCGAKVAQASLGRTGATRHRLHAFWCLHRSKMCDAWRCDSRLFLAFCDAHAPAGHSPRPLDRRLPMGPDNVTWVVGNKKFRTKHTDNLEGRLMTEVAADLGVSRQRVFQLLKKYGTLSALMEARQ